jgi:hypothetical protein
MIIIISMILGLIALIFGVLRWKGMLTHEFWKGAERVKLLVEISAFAIGGMWVLFTFIREESRTYQERGALEEDLNWQKLPDEVCEVQYTITFRNLAKIPVTIGATQIQVWRLSAFPQVGAAKPAQYIDPMPLRLADRLGDPLVNAFTERFNATYQPDESDQEGFTFHLDKSIQGIPVLFEISIWDDEGAKNLPSKDRTKGQKTAKPRWHDDHWDRVCADERPREISCKAIKVGNDHNLKCITEASSGASD